ELLAIGRRLRADRKALTDLRDDDADLARGHLNPRELLDPVEDAELPAQARHEQVRLIARLSLERDRIVVAETARRHALRHETDLGRPDRMERRDDDQGDYDDRRRSEEREHGMQHQQGEHGLPPSVRAGTTPARAARTVFVPPKPSCHSGAHAEPSPGSGVVAWRAHEEKGARGMRRSCTVVRGSCAKRAANGSMAAAWSCFRLLYCDTQARAGGFR